MARFLDEIRAAGRFTKPWFVPAVVDRGSPPARYVHQQWIGSPVWDQKPQLMKKVNWRWRISVSSRTRSLRARAWIVG